MMDDDIDPVDEFFDSLDSEQNTLLLSEAQERVKFTQLSAQEV